MSKAPHLFRDHSLPPREDDVSWLYVFAAEGKITKIGFAVDIDLRLRRVQRSRPFGVQFFCAYAVVTPPAGSVVQQAEQLAHRNLAARRIGGEWFLATPAQAELAVRAAVASMRLPIRQFPVTE